MSPEKVVFFKKTKSETGRVDSIPPNNSKSVFHECKIKYL